MVLSALFATLTVDSMEVRLIYNRSTRRYYPIVVVYSTLYELWSLLVSLEKSL